MLPEQEIPLAEELAFLDHNVAIQKIRFGENRAFIVWRITAKKRMVAKLKAIKAELQRRKHHRMTAVGEWLRKVVLGYYQYHVVPGNSTQLRIFNVEFAGCGEVSLFVVANAHSCDGLVSPQS